MAFIVEETGTLYYEGKMYIDPNFESNEISPVGLSENAAGGTIGVDFLDESYFAAPTIDADIVRHYARDIPIVASNLEKYRRFIFTGAKVTVVPPVDVEIPENKLKEVQQNVNELDRIIKTVTRMNQAWWDKKVYGSSIFEYKSGKIGNWIKAPKVFKHLPGHSFDTTPTQRMSDPDRYIDGDILKGIIFDNDTGDYEFWQRQTQGGTPVQIDSKNVIHVRDEVADSPDGKSAIAVIVGLVRRLEFAEKALTQTVNRSAAPTIQASVKEYREYPITAELWTFPKAYKEAQKIMKNWGKDTVMVTPDCINITPLDTKLAIDPMKVIDHYEKRILYTLIAKDFTEQTAQAISTSGSPGLTLLVLMARSEQEDIAQPFIELWRQVLDANNLEGWNVEIQFRDLLEASEDQLYVRAKLMSEVGNWTADEIREQAGWPALTDEQKLELGAIPSAEKQPEEQPRGEVPEESKPESELLEDSIKLNSETIIEDLLKTKSSEFIKYCDEKGIAPWDIKYESE